MRVIPPHVFSWLTPMAFPQVTGASGASMVPASGRGRYWLATRMSVPQPGHWNGDVFGPKKNKMKPTNPNAHTYVNGTDVKTHGYAVTHNTFLQ